MRPVGALVAVMLVCFAGMTADAEAQSDTRVRGRANSQPVSARTVATWQLDQIGSEAPRLYLLILYRGEPGWHQKDQENARFEVSDEYHVAPGGRLLGRFEFRQRTGGRELHVSVDRTKSEAVVVGHRMSLVSANVIVIDDADSGAGPPRVVYSLYVDAKLTSLRSDVVALVRNDPRLARWLR